MNGIAADLLIAMPVGIAALIFLCTVGGWGLKRRS